MVRHLAIAALSALVLSGCETAGTPDTGADTAVAEMLPQPAPGRRSGRGSTGDVEAPHVFSTRDQGLWDGRPSLGGVWVASPEAKDPERVMIRNTANGKSVTGALFRRERDNPGPRLQVSSDAAVALGMLAGAPAELSVVALRRTEPAAPAPEPAPGPVAAAAKPAKASATTPPETAEAAAPERPRPFWRRKDQGPNPSPVADTDTSPEGATAAPPAPPPASPSSATPPAPSGQAGGTLIQIGIFSVEANARQAVTALSADGVPTEVRREGTGAKPYWRVLAVPSSAADRATLMATVKRLGFKDAFFVTR